MIDLHCHLLPGIDDGPETLSESVAMARHAVHNGIKRAVVTPHIHQGRYENNFRSIQRAVEAFSAELERLDIQLALGFAAEVRIGPEIMDLVQNATLPYLGELDGYKIVLLEFPHSQIPLGSEKMIGWLLSKRVRPMIAHPERNKDVIRNIDKILPYVQMGCFLQVTAGSVAGNFGLPAMQRAEQMLERGWVTILASDAHNLNARPPELEPGRAAAEKIVGASASWAMVLDIPAAISKSQFERNPEAILQ